MTESADGDQSTERSSGSRIAVIGKSVRVLDALAEMPRGATPGELAEKIGTNRSTAFRLLSTLEHEQLLRRDTDTGRYRLGTRMLWYAEAVRAEFSIITIAEPAMWELEEKLQQTVYLSARQGWGANCIHRLPGRNVDVMAWKTGQWLPFHLGAGPKALVAALDDPEIERYLAAGEDRTTRQGELSADDIRASIAETRQRGWSLNVEAITEGVASLGAAVRGSTGPICAISVAGLERDYRGDALEKTSAAVLGAVRRLEHELTGAPRS